MRVIPRHADESHYIVISNFSALLQKDLHKQYISGPVGLILKLLNIRITLFRDGMKGSLL